MERILSNPEVNQNSDLAKSVFPDHYLYSLLIERKQVPIRSRLFLCFDA